MLGIIVRLFSKLLVRLTDDYFPNFSVKILSSYLYFILYDRI